MKKRYLIGLAIIFGLFSAMAQEKANCACCTENHGAFDFWEGEWTVYDASENVIGKNSIVKIQDNCILQENWEAANKSNTGSSYNYYNNKDNTWNQVWVSNTGNILNLKGNLDDSGNMVLRSEMIEGSKGKYYNQITWSKNEDGSVTQLWEIISEKGELITNSFEGIYRRSDE